MNNPELISVFETADLFGKSFEFTFGGKNKFKTKIGGYLTIISVLITIYCVWLLGNEIIFRNLPRDYQIQYINLQPRNLTMQVPFAFMIKDRRGNIIEDYDRYIVFEAFYYDMFRTNGRFESSEKPKSIPLKKCTESDFSNELKEEFRSLRIQYAICLAVNHQVLGGDFNLDFSKFIAVEVRNCLNTTTRTNCAPKEETFSFLNRKDVVISVKHEKILYSSRNFSHPVNKFIAEDNILIDPYILNFPKYLMEEFTVDTDSGIVGTANSLENYYQFGSMTNDIITAFDDNGNIPDNLLLYEYSFFESLTEKIQVRSYLKLTEMLASLGGILNVYIMIFSFLFHTIYERVMYEEILLRLFNFDKVKFENTLVNERIVSKLKKSRNSVAQNIKYSYPIPIPRRCESNKKINVPTISRFERNNNKNNNNSSSSSSNNDINNNNNNSNNNSKCDNDNNKNSESRPSFFNKNNVRQLINRNRVSFKPINTPTPNQKEKYTSTVDLSTIKSIKDKNKNYIKIFSSCSHILLSFCFCFTKCSSNLKETNDKFKKLVELNYNYTDILFLIKHLYEFERLKLIIFNKKQIAAFNCIPLPDNPLLKTKDNVNIRYKFLHDFEAQKRKQDDFFKEEHIFTEDNKINKRIKKLSILS